MKIPGFNAEASLHASKHKFESPMLTLWQNKDVVPAMRCCGTCEDMCDMKYTGSKWESCMERCLGIPCVECWHRGGYY